MAERSQKRRKSPKTTNQPTYHSFSVDAWRIFLQNVQILQVHVLRPRRIDLVYGLPVLYACLLVENLDHDHNFKCMHKDNETPSNRYKDNSLLTLTFIFYTDIHVAGFWTSLPPRALMFHKHNIFSKYFLFQSTRRPRDPARRATVVTYNPSSERAVEFEDGSETMSNVEGPIASFQRGGWIRNSLPLVRSPPNMYDRRTGKVPCLT